MFSNKGRKREIIPHTNTRTHEHMTTRQHDNKMRTHTQIIPHTTHEHTTTRQQDNKTTRQQHTHKQIPHTIQHNTTQHKKEGKKNTIHTKHTTQERKKNGRYHRRRRNSYWK
jgi:hypothetical protein